MFMATQVIVIVYHMTHVYTIFIRLYLYCVPTLQRVYFKRITNTI